MPEKIFSKISFYIVAHADDWQLFMQPNVYNDLVSADTNVVFIVTTAGDAGFEEKFWTAREEGMKSSLRFCLAPLSIIEEKSGQAEFNGHTINYATTGDVKSYFLRLPDGNIDGNGFEKNDHESLSRFRSGQVSRIMALDHSTTYDCWEDFCITLEQIIVSDSGDIQNTWVNYLNPDPGSNPNDHSDHIATGLGLQATQIISAVNQALFVGYSLSENQQPLLAADLFWKAGMFAAYEKAVWDKAGYSTLKEGVDIYQRWCLSSPSFITVSPK